jgi:aminomethyltransferase
LATPLELALKRTQLNPLHKALGAKMVEFGGWEMPVEYSGIIQEHLAVRRAAGLFDVSHMGEVEVRGPGALALLERVTCNEVSRLEDFQAQYNALMHPRGTAVDDCVVHRLAADHYFLCVNAANTERDFEWILSHRCEEAEVKDVSGEYAQLALQGPRSTEIISKVTEASVEGLKYYWFCPARCCGVDGLLARTGYTGEDGFEFYFPPAASERVWNTLLEAGRPVGLVPAGLGARNTLRLEAGYALYGHELNDDTTLLEANLGWIVRLEKGEFLGRSVLLEQRRLGTRKKLVGFEMTGPGIARDGQTVFANGERCGAVTSGSYAPFLKKSIGLAYVSPALAEVGREIEVEIRGKRVGARIVSLPFYRRPK